MMALWFVTIALLGVRFIVPHPDGPARALAHLRRRLRHAQRRHHLRRSSARSSSPSPAARRSTPTWATSARGPSASPGSRWSCPRSCSTTSGRARSCSHDPSARGNPFFAMVPAGALTYVLVALSATATVIASQALISGAFSLTRQAIQLGYLPRFDIRHTSSDTEGQIYIGAINWLLAIVCLALVLVVPELERARRRLRHRRHRHDGHHQRLLLRRPARGLEVAAVEGAAAARRLPGHRSDLLRLQPAQVRRRRLRAHRRRRRGLRDHGGVAARARAAPAPHPAKRHPIPRASSPRRCATAWRACPAPACS